MKNITLFLTLFLLTNLHTLQGQIDFQESSPNVSKEELPFVQTCDQEFDASNIENNLLLKVDFQDQISDSSGNDIDITNTSVELVEDRFDNNSSGAFGNSKFLELGNEQILKPDFPMSFSFWVKQNETGLNKNYIYTSDLQLDKRAGFAISFGAFDNKLIFFYSDEIGCYNPSCRRQVTSVDPIESGEWVHLSIVVKGYNDSNFYVNGCEIPVEYSGSGAVDLYYTDESSYIGFADNSNQPTSQRAYFGGEIDDFCFWNRIITEEEILYLYDRFEVPELEIAEEYTIPLNDNSVEITVDDKFTEVNWSDGQMVNTAVFSEEGTYEVEAFYDCHLVCSSFVVIKEENPFVQTCDQEFDGSGIGQDLLLHYDLDGNTLDSGPNLIHGVNNGGEISPDRFQQQNAYSFDGSSNIIIPHDNQYKVQFPISISTWVKWGSSESNKNGVFSTNFEQDNYHGVFMLRLASTGQVFLGYGTGTGGITLQNRRAIISDTETELDTWYHIVGTIDGPNDFHLYIDGCEETFSYTGDENPVIAYNTNDGFIGKLDNSNTVPSNDLIGTVDDFYFWNRIITEEEILYLYDRFEVPELEIAEEYTIPLNDNSVEITVDNNFTQVNWSDGQMGNTAVFSEEGTYEVEAFYDCHLVCTSFIVEKEIVLPPEECEFFQSFNGHCGSSQYKCVLAEEYGGPKYYVEGEITIPAGYDLCNEDLNENITSLDEVYIFEQTRMAEKVVFRAFVTVTDNSIFEAIGSEIEFAICDFNNTEVTCLTYSLPAGQCTSDYNCTIDFTGVTAGSENTINVNYCMVLHELDVDDCPSAFDISVMLTNASDMKEIFTTTLSDNLDEYQCISVPITIEQFMDPYYQCMEVVISNACIDISCSRFDCNLLSNSFAMSGEDLSREAVGNIRMNDSSKTQFANRKDHSVTSYDEVNIYPVPTSHNLYVEARTNDKMNLVDHTGRKVSVAYESFGDKMQLDLSKLSNGMYYLVIERDNAIFDVKKVIKTN